MTQPDNQAAVAAWHRATFGQDCPISWIGLKLAAEAGEACQAVLTLEGEPQREGRAYEDIETEMADVLIALYALADRTGIDLNQAFWGRLGEVELRRYQPAG